MPTPAGTGLTRRKFLSRSAGLALAVYGASKIPLSAFERGHRRGGARRDQVLVSIFFEGGIDALSVLAPVGDPRYATLRPTLALAPGAGTAFTEDTRLQWHPGAPASRRSTTRARSPPSRRSATTTPTSRTSPRATTTRSVSSTIGPARGWLGRYLDAVGDEENPLQGLSMDGTLSPMLATAQKPVAAIDGVDGYDLWSRGQRPDRHRDVQELRQVRRAAVRLAGAAPGPPGDLADREAARGTDRDRRLRTARSPTRNTDFAHKLAGLANYLDRGLPMRVVTLSAAGGYDTHSDQAEDLEQVPRAKPATASSPSSATSKPAASTTA